MWVVKIFLVSDNVLGGRLSAKYNSSQQVSEFVNKRRKSSRPVFILRSWSFLFKLINKLQLL